ncbi:MAG: hypothetical protein NVSMB3_05150 [Acidobacteriaceae bacterium]
MEATFARTWTVTTLDRPPLIAPARRYTFPREVAGEEDAMARGALELMVRPNTGEGFLATCALGFKASEMPTGVWGCPAEWEMCAAAGGYAYIIDTLRPEVSHHIPLRPVVEIRELVQQELLLFSGFHTVAAWGPNGMAWESARLSWEGLRLGAVENNLLHGFGWDVRSDKELPFTVDLRTGEHTGGGFLR